jgi:hypothetical protein
MSDRKLGKTEEQIAPKFLMPPLFITNIAKEIYYEANTDDYDELPEVERDQWYKVAHRIVAGIRSEVAKEILTEIENWYKEDCEFKNQCVYKHVCSNNKLSKDYECCMTIILTSECLAWESFKDGLKKKYGVE